MLLLTACVGAPRVARLLSIRRHMDR
jgi:hypothetical protein